MAAEGEFESHARAGLALFGIDVDETDLAVMSYFNDVYGPLQEKLLATDFAQIRQEPNLDPSRPPAGHAR